MFDTKKLAHQALWAAIKAGAVPLGADDGRIEKEIASTLEKVIATERQACADIASAMDSARGNEQEIARAIRARSK